MESIIKWQTGMPEQSGLYLVTLSTGEVTVMEWYNPYTSSPYWLEEEREVVAWCDFKDMEPYKMTMAVTIIKEKKLRTPVFYAKCPCCGAEFTYEGEDVVSTIETQTEGAAYGVRCPRCNYPFWANREIYTYLLK